MFGYAAMGAAAACGAWPGTPQGGGGWARSARGGRGGQVESFAGDEAAVERLMGPETLHRLADILSPAEPQVPPCDA